MILTPKELQLLIPQIDLLNNVNHSAMLETKITIPGGRTVAIKVAAAGVYIQASYPDDAASMEFYKTVQGLAQAYGNRILMSKAQIN